MAAPGPGRERLVFANQLRGLAALSVAGSHLIGVFWAMRGFVAASTFTPPQPGSNPPLFAVANHPWFELGPFGVAIFFLISGLVVPFSLQRHSRGSFLLARLLRIYPTYIVVFLFEMGVLYFNSRFWHRPFIFNFHDILTNCLLINNLVGVPTLDFVNWTLAVEIKFYLLLCLVYAGVKRGNIAGIFGIAAILGGINLLRGTGLGGAGWKTGQQLLEMFSQEAVYIQFMLIGVLFNFHVRGKLGTQGLALGTLCLTALFLVCWRSSVIAAQYPIVPINYLYGLALFAALYGLRGHVPSSRFLDLVAAISFPFYLLHSLVGYSLMKFFMLHAGLGYMAALGISLVALVALASVFHLTIERSTIALGRRLEPGRTRQPPGQGRQNIQEGVPECPIPQHHETAKPIGANTG